MPAICQSGRGHGPLLRIFISFTRHQSVAAQESVSLTRHGAWRAPVWQGKNF